MTRERALVIAFAILAVSACSAQVNRPSDTDYERAITQKGLLTLSEYFPIGDLDDKVSGTVLVVTKAMANERLYAFRLVISNNGSGPATQIRGCVFDVYELPKIIGSLEYMLSINMDGSSATLVQVTYLSDDGTQIDLIENGAQDLLTLWADGVVVSYRAHQS